MKRYVDVICDTPELKNNSTLGPLRARLMNDRESGHPAEADQSRRELAELDKTDPVRIALGARLDDVSRGLPAGNTGERLTLAELAYRKERYAVSVRLYTEAFAANPKIVDDRRTQHPYNLACAASLTGSRLGKDDPPPDAAAQAEFRRQALKWLKYDLDVWSKVLDSGSPETKGQITPTLRQLWSDVDKLLAKISGGR